MGANLRKKKKRKRRKRRKKKKRKKKKTPIHPMKRFQNVIKGKSCGYNKTIRGIKQDANDDTPGKEPCPAEGRNDDGEPSPVLSVEVRIDVAPAPVEKPKARKQFKFKEFSK